MPNVFQYTEKMMDEQLALNEIKQSSYDRKMETLKMLSAISDKPLENDDIHYSDKMLLSMFTGMRVGECCALMVDDICMC